MPAPSQASPIKNTRAMARSTNTRPRAAGSIHAIPARNTPIASSRRKGPRKVSRVFRFAAGRTRFSAISVRRRTGRESSRDSAAAPINSRTRAIHRHTGVSSSVQVTSGAGKTRSMGESLASCAIRGINATVSGENTHIASPDRNVTRSISTGKALPLSEKVSMRSRSPGSPSFGRPPGSDRCPLRRTPDRAPGFGTTAALTAGRHSTAAPRQFAKVHIFSRCFVVPGAAGIQERHRRALW